MENRPVRSPSGGVQVLTTDRGLPIRLKIDKRELNRSPQDLAAEILALCRFSAAQAQVAQRKELAERGFAPSVYRDFDLATEEDLAAAKRALVGPEDDDDQPDTWMRSV